MDNLTHSLIGLIAGECVARTAPGPQQGLSVNQRRMIILLMFIIGGNLPDIDLLLTLPILGSDPLRYVIQHRGYTHTLVGCCALAFCLYAGVEVWARRRHLNLLARDRRLFLATATVGCLLHLGMDYLNSYGVHPFWPWYNGWVYGDAIFIVEPLFWLAAAPLIAAQRSAVSRSVLLLIVPAGTVAAVFLHRHQPLQAMGITVVTAALYVAGRSLPPRAAALLSGATAVLVTAAFAYQGHRAGQLAQAIADSGPPGQQVLDRVLAPLPTNPMCWDMLLLTTEGGTYRARHATLSTQAEISSAANCPAMPTSSAVTLAPMQAVPAADSAAVHWLGQYEISRRTLRRVALSNCETLELMQFLRVPFVASIDGKWLLGDLRFDRGRTTGIAQVTVGGSTPTTCSASSPWTGPRMPFLIEMGTR